MKTYLNRQETSDLILLMEIGARARDFADGWKSRDMITSKEAGAIRQAATLIGNVSEVILNRQPLDMLLKLRKSADAYRLDLVKKPMTAREEAEYQKSTEERVIPCRVDMLDGLAEMALISCCSPCMRGTEEERLSCPGRDVFFGLGIPMFDENAPKGVCPWEVRKDEDE